jgi:hypothetical protein
MEYEDHVRRMPWTVGETPHDHAANWPVPGEDPRTRAQKLKALKGSRGDTMLGEAAKVKDRLMKWVREDERAKAWAIIHAIIVSLVCMVFFTVMMLVWFELYHKSFGWSVVIFALCLFVCTFICWFGARKRDDGLWIVVMGCFSILVTFIGLFWGFYMYYQHLVYFRHYQELRSYTNTAGSTPASRFNDASMFLFTKDTRLDVMRSVGYKSRWTGQTYCAAPVVDSSMTSADHISFWAVGDNCCLARGDFVCDDAQDSRTMTALVVLEPEDVVRPFMRWAVQGSKYPRYERAIKLQEAAYATRAASQIKMLYWSKDPIALQDSFYYNAKNATIWFAVLLWVFILFVGYVICYKFRSIRPRLDKRLENKPILRQQANGQAT